MAFNPFLSFNEPAASATTELNPFMSVETDNTDFTANDNPFATSNPFSDFGDNYEPPAGDTVPIDIFGNAEPVNVGAKQFDENNSINIFDSHYEQNTSSNEKLVKPTELDLIPTIVDDSYVQTVESNSQPAARPVPQETQNLILSVTGQMEFTSSHLLNRIPPTRTPSPVSVRDIHSPSPTPDQNMMEDLPITTANTDMSKSKPARPPPARPPRPAPPPRPQAPPPTQADDINLFDAPAPVVVKPTKEAILSLYSAPKKEEKAIDFLSDDILDMPSTEELPSNISPSSVTTTTVVESSALIFTESIATVAGTKNETESLNDSEVKLDNEIEKPCSDMDISEPVNKVTNESLEDSESPFANLENVSSENQPFSEIEKNPFEGSDEMTTAETLGVATDIFGMKSDQMRPNASSTTTFQSTQANIFDSTSHHQESPMDVTSNEIDTNTNIFESGADVYPDASQLDNTTDLGWGPAEPMAQDAFPESSDAFDAFSAKFDSASGNHMATDAWGEDGGAEAAASGFESEAFDPFLSLGAPPPPAATPRLDHQPSQDSTDDTFSVFIRPKESTGAEGGTGGAGGAVPALAPPPRAPPPDSPRVNPFDAGTDALHQQFQSHQPELGHARSGSRGSRGSGGETPPTPLFDDDVSQPLEDFPRTKYSGPGWEMHLRQPNKKKITGQRFWKKVWVRLVTQGEAPVVQLLGSASDREPLQELPLQACYSVSDVGAQQFDQFGKIFTVKLQYVFYKERPGVRPGQVTKAERITNKLSQFAAYAIQGDYQGVKEFGSDLRKLGLPVEHAPQVSQLFKLGSLNYEHVKEFSCCIEEALFRLSAHRDRALTYKMEEVQLTAVDELYVEQDAEGSVLKQIARVRLFFLGFLSGMPDVELGVNDLRRQGKEVVGRHDIIPVATEEWIRVEDPEFHACVQPQEFDDTQIIKFKPPDACYIELMRFRVRPPKNRELPLQLKAVWCVTGNKVELRADALVPGFASRSLGQVPCEDVAVRFPIPECWIYLFRVEKHFRYGSVKSAHRRTGKIKGIERFLGAVETLQESLIEVTSGQAKYEHQHRAIVWRMPRLPKEGQGAYTTHNLVCRMALTSYDQVPAELAKWALVEFTMPATQVSHMTVRSVSLQNHDADPPEKYVRYLARHEYMVGIERTTGQATGAYTLAASAPAPPAAPAPAAPAAPRPPSSDSDSD